MWRTLLRPQGYTEQRSLRSVATGDAARPRTISTGYAITSSAELRNSWSTYRQIRPPHALGRAQNLWQMTDARLRRESLIGSAKT